MTATLARTMPAVAYLAPGRAGLVRWPQEARPLGADEVEGRTLATLVSPGTEMQAYLADRQTPAVGGYAAVFRVDAVGTAVTDVRLGDVLFTPGPHAAVQRAARSAVVPVPPGLLPTTAVFGRLAGVGWSTLTTTMARPPDAVLILGLGPVGNLAAQVFQAAGYRVLAVDPDPQRLALARTHGLTATTAEIPAQTEPLALAVDCSGHEQAVLGAVERVRRGGEVVLVGVPWRPRTDLRAHALLHAIFHRYVILRSGWEWEVPLQPQEFRHGSIQGNWAAAMAWLAQGRLRMDGLAEIESPAAAETAWERLRAQRGAPTTVFDWTALEEDQPLVGSTEAPSAIH